MKGKNTWAVSMLDIRDPFEVDQKRTEANGQKNKKTNDYALGTTSQRRTMTDYLYQERSEEENLPPLKTGLDTSIK